jgi:murein peptide amidase A
MIRMFGLLAFLATLDSNPIDTLTCKPSVLIRPFNYDPADPCEYTRRRGQLSPGAISTSAIWNRPPGYRTRHHSRDEAEASVLPRVLIIGSSVKGIPIPMHVYGQETRPLLIFAAIHGDEANTAGVVRRLVEYLDSHPEACRGCSVAVIPVANPDGLARGTRCNARDVDVNRNLPARNWRSSDKGRYHGGTEHSSEPETRALIQAVELLDPRGIISLHCIQRGRHGNNYDGPGEELARLLSARNGYRVLKTIGYPTPGSFGSWAGVDRAIPTVTLELPSDMDGEAAWRENREALLDAIQHLK